ncbi:MAG: TetR family transcriptional regulator [Thermoleophilia bacterium]|nr:TetR family transcriptional regulator [Thermoleophilia bacterium]
MGTRSGDECAFQGLRERKKAQTRRTISDVATRLFMERGFDAVTLAEVAEAAGVSVKTIFNYFGSKEDLYLDRDAELRAHLLGAITDRGPGVTITAALGALLTEHRIPDGRGWGAMYEPGALAGFRRFLEVWRASPALQARALVWGRRLQDDLRDVIAAEAGRSADDEAVRTMAAMLAATAQLRHATLAEWVLADRPPAEVERGVRAVSEEAIARVARAFPDLDVPAPASAEAAAG